MAIVTNDGHSVGDIVLDIMRPLLTAVARVLDEVEAFQGNEALEDLQKAFDDLRGEEDGS